MTWLLTRRELLAAGFTTAVVGAAGIPLEGSAAEPRGWRWGRSVCRLCGVGCGVAVASFSGRIVAVRGDPENPVNRGLLCAKGYALPLVQYGADRLTRPLLRKRGGRFDRRGDFEPVGWDEAFDVMARAWRRAHAALGPTGVALVGSGQWTIAEGYAAAKLAKAGWRTNNLEANARLGTSSAVAALLQTFGADGSSGCYDDIELTDAIVAWGANMAETYPVLWARIADRRLRSPSYRVVHLTTCRDRSSDLADVPIVIRPNADLAIWNYVAREVIARGGVDRAFVRDRCVFATGPTSIGYGGPGHDERAPAGAHWLISYDEFKAALEPYTLESVAELSRGDPDEPLDAHRAKLRALAELYADPHRKVVSFWSAGMNQHTRGTWVNEQAYMVHLLAGKQARPGSGAFPLTGQPSGCGTAREVGTFADRLPAGMRVDEAAHRADCEHRWRLPARTLNPKPGGDLTTLMRDLEDGALRWMWIQATNPFQSTANADRWLHAAREQDCFIAVSDAYPTVSTKVADLVLPSAMVFEKWGAYGNAERRTQMWREQVPPPGEARGDLWQILEFSKRFKLSEVWGRQRVPGLEADGFERGALPDVLADAERMGHAHEATLYDALFATPANRRFAWPDPVARGHENHTVAHGGADWFAEKALFEEYAGFGRGRALDLAPFDLHFRDDVHGLRWPVVDGKETRWRYNEEHDPYARRGTGIDFYGPAMKAIPRGDRERVTDPELVPVNGRAKIFFRPEAAPPESPDARYDLWLCTARVLEHWGTGTMTRRVPALHAAVPEATAFMHEQDARARGLGHGDLAWIESRRGRIPARVELGGRSRVPRGTVLVPWFDEGILVNRLTLDASCPISRQTDFKKCAVKVVRRSVDAGAKP